MLDYFWCERKKPFLLWHIFTTYGYAISPPVRKICTRHLMFQNEKLLNSTQATQAKLLGRVLKMAAYDSSSGFVDFINVKDSLKDVARTTKWNRIQHHQMWTFHPRQSHWWAKTMSISFDLYWFRLEQRRECIVLSVSLLDSYQLKCYRRFILTKLNKHSCGLVSSVAEHWSRKPGDEGSTPSRGCCFYSNASWLKVSSLLWYNWAPFTSRDSSLPFSKYSPFLLSRGMQREAFLSPLSFFALARYFVGPKSSQKPFPSALLGGLFSAFKLGLCNMVASWGQWQSTGLVKSRCCAV